jgi:transcriptional antiterminator NusG
VRKYEERSAARRLREALGPDRYLVFCPTKDYITLRKGGDEWKRRIPVFSNYVFIAAESDEASAFAKIKPLVNEDRDIFRLLAYDGDHAGIALHERDKALLLALMNDEFNIQALEAVLEGDRVIITDEALEGFQGRVRRVDKHRRTAEVEFEMPGRTIVGSIALEIVERI